MSTDTEKQINSHIQMPKCVLKRFETNGSFFYYDVINDQIRTNGHAKSLNTNEGFYSNETEGFLDKNIEDPFGKLLLSIDTISSDPPKGSIDSVFDSIAKIFAYALVARNPSSIAHIIRAYQYEDDVSQQIKNELGMLFGLISVTESNPFNAYGTTIVENRTDMPFVLPICGVYFSVFNGFEHAILPVSPKKAIVFIEEKGKQTIINNGIVHLYSIIDPSIICSLNINAVKTQCRYKNGYVVCPNKEALKSALRGAKVAI